LLQTVPIASRQSQDHWCVIATAVHAFEYNTIFPNTEALEVSTAIGVRCDNGFAIEPFECISSGQLFLDDDELPIERVGLGASADDLD
jgi:hypothetical protein